MLNKFCRASEIAARICAVATVVVILFSALSVRAEFMPPSGQWTPNDLTSIERSGSSFYAAGEAGTIISFHPVTKDWQVLESGTRRKFSTSISAFGKAVFGAGKVDVFSFSTVPQGNDLVYFDPSTNANTLKETAGIPRNYNQFSSFAASEGFILGYAIQESGPGGRTAARIHSSDGVSWTATPVAFGAAYFNYLQFFDGHFYGLDTQNGKVMRSVNGEYWVEAATLETTIPMSWVRTFEVSGSNLVIGGANGKLIHSTDGQSWNSTSPVLAGKVTIHGIAHYHGVHVLVGSGGSIARSHDLINWTDVSPEWSQLDWLNVDAGPDGFIAVGQSGSVAWSDTHGSTWEVLSYPPIRSADRLVQSSGPLMYISNDGKTAEFQKTGSVTTDQITLPFMPTSIHQSGGIWIAGAASGSIAVSQDGEIWTSSNRTSGASILKIISGAGIFVALAADGAVLKSEDGLSWTTAGQIPGPTDITYADGFYHAAGHRADFPSPVLFISNDLHTWDAAVFASLNSNTFRLTGIAAGNGVVVASSASRSVSSKGHLAYPSVYYSTNGGKTFDHTVLPLSNVGLRGVVFDGERFIVYGDGGVCRTSIDGIQWSVGDAEGLSVDDYVAGVSTGAGVLLRTGKGQVLADINVDYFQSHENMAPVAHDDEVTISAGDYIYIDVLANDSDPDGSLDPLSIEILSHPFGGDLIVNPGEPVRVGPVVTTVPDGIVIYVHNSLLYGHDSFTYRVADTEGGYSEPATVRIQITEPAPQIFHNPVGLLTVDASLSDWQGVSPVAMDPRDAHKPDDGLDWRNIYLAHDSHFLYVAYDSYLPITLNWAHNIFIDCDENESSGLQYAGMGVDILIQQGRVYKYLGDGTSWEWLNLFTANQAVISNTVEIAIPRIAVGHNNQIHLAFHATNAAYGPDSTLDIFPESGGFISYNLETPGQNLPPAAHPGSHALMAGDGIDFSFNAFDPENAPLTLIVVRSPSHGQVTGTFPDMRYVSADGFTGVDKMIWKVSDGVHTSAEVVEEFVVYPPTNDGYSSFPVLNINIDGHISDWASIPAMAEDPDDVRPQSPSLIDWQRIWMANTPYHLVIAAQTFESNPISSDFNIFMDTDENENTGFLGHPNTKRINGGDYLLQGQFLFRYTGTGHDWSWEFVSPVLHARHETTHEWKLSLADLGNPTTVRTLLKAEISQFYRDQLPVIEISAVNDFFPDGSREYSSDDVLKYRIADNPIKSASVSAGIPVDMRPSRPFRILLQVGTPKAVSPEVSEQSSMESGLEIQVQSSEGVNWRVEQSHDLHSWSDISSLKLEASQSILVVPANSSEASFYRAVPVSSENR